MLQPPAAVNSRLRTCFEIRWFDWDVFPSTSTNLEAGYVSCFISYRNLATKNNSTSAAGMLLLHTRLHVKYTKH